MKGALGPAAFRECFKEWMHVLVVGCLARLERLYCFNVSRQLGGAIGTSYIWIPTIFQ